MATQRPQLTDSEYVDAIRRELRLARVLGEPVIVNWWLVVSNVALFVIAYGYGFRLTDGWGFVAKWYQPLQMVFYSGMKVNEHIVAGDWWRLVSSMWVHLDLLHIGFNVYGLWILGPLLEKFYGARRYFVMYMVSGIVAAAASFYFNDINSGGASGAIYGLVGALLVFGYRYRDALPERVVRGFTTGLLPWVALSIGIGFFEAIPFDNAAHLGGLATGAVLALVMGSKLRPQRTERVGHYALTGGAIVSGVVIVLTAWFWSAEATECLSSREGYLECYPELEQTLTDPDAPPPR